MFFWLQPEMLDLWARVVVYVPNCQLVKSEPRPNQVIVWTSEAQLDQPTTPPRTSEAELDQPTHDSTARRLGVRVRAILLRSRFEGFTSGFTSGSR